MIECIKDFFKKLFDIDRELTKAEEQELVKAIYKKIKES